MISFTLLNSISFAEKKKECSHYTTKNFAGLSDYLRCKKGLPPLEKSFLKDLQWSKEKQSKRKKIYQPGTPCNEYSTKTFAGLFAKMKCKRDE